ncbi:MAG: hypothetical protein AAB639_02265 [Patescibacteria group bacterium]
MKNARVNFTEVFIVARLATKSKKEDCPIKEEIWQNQYIFEEFR